jgi:hypothetical protein
MKSLVGRYLDEKLNEICFFSPVRPSLEYAASIWNPGYEGINPRTN